MILLATSIWVLVDTVQLGVRKGVLFGSFYDMGPAGWFFACLLLWFVAVPCYLHARPRYLALAGHVSRQPATSSHPHRPLIQSGRVTAHAAAAAAHQPPLPSANPSAAPFGVSLAEQISKLASLHSRGVLTDEEFTAAKTRLLRA